MKSKSIAALIVCTCFHNFPIRAAHEMPVKEQVMLSFICFTWASAVGSLLYEAYYKERENKDKS